MNDWLRQLREGDPSAIQQLVELVPEGLASRLRNDFLTQFFAAYLATLVLTLLSRTFAGATPFYLIRSRFHEIPPVRALLHLTFWTIRGAGVWSGIVAAQQGLRAWNTWDSGNRGHAVITGVALLVTVLTWKIGTWFQSHAVDKRDIPAPQVRVRVKGIRNGISEELLRHLGLERFPNEYGAGWKSGLWTRALLAIAFWCCAGTMALGWLHPDDSPMADQIVIMTLRVLEQIPHYSTAQLLFPGTCCLVPLLCLLFTNRDYLMASFPSVLLLNALLLSGCAAQVLLISRNPQSADGWLAILFALHGWRYSSDINRAWGYFRMRRVYKPIVERIRRHFFWIDEMPTRPDCALKPLEEHHLRQRIAQGATNLEEYGVLTTRNYGRFLRVSDVHHQPFAAAMFRYLTVRRFVGTSGGTGTSRMLQHPVVPRWNEDLFPLKPPSSYVNWTDPLWLNSSWDIVSICGRCSGRGWVERTETENYTDSSGKSQTRSVTKRETCGSCGGTGRLQYSQILNTQWQRLMPTLTSPEVPLPELLEDAEERVYYSLPLIEDRTPLARQGINGGLEQEYFQDVHAEALSLTANIAEESDEVMKLHGGEYLYRADFQLTGFHVITIRFPRLLFQRGWFFGARPEFHFPRVPLSLSMLATLTFFPPLAIFWGITCFVFAREALNALP
jgi:ABC-type amino acid transport system permease subunit